MMANTSSVASGFLIRRRMALNALRHSMGRFGGDEANVVFICSVAS
jgi:hypothetical protein